MSDIVTVNCGVRLSIDQIDNLYAECETAIGTGSNIEMDCSQVEYCDTAGLQLVLSVKETLLARGCEFSWKSPTQVLTQTAQYLGLVSALNFSNE